jgi:hypothetical protein
MTRVIKAIISMYEELFNVFIVHQVDADVRGQQAVVDLEVAQEAEANAESVLPQAVAESKLNNLIFYFKLLKY